jgi:hypothetical protein
MSTTATSPAIDIRVEGRGQGRALSWPHWRFAAILAFLFLATLALRLPARTGYLVNWDSVQYAFATEGYDLHHHRPHPPGYIGYVFAGRALNAITGDANASFVLLSLAAGAAAPALFLLLAREVLGGARAYIATVLFAGSPLLWYHSGVALSYAPEAALASAFGILAWRARERGGKWLLAAAVGLALVGSMRQTSAVLLFPLLAWSAQSVRWRLRLAAAGLLAGASLTWLVPLLWLAGGPQAFLRESAALAEFTAGPTAAFSGDAVSIARNWAIVGASLLATVGFGPVAVLAARTAGPPPGRVGRAQAVFVLTWFLPGFTVFSLLHMGQAGYILLLAPPLSIALGFLLPHEVPRRTLLATVLGACLAAHAAVVLWLPGAVYQRAAADSALAGHIRQYATRASDHHWADLVAIARRFDPDRTVIVTAIGGPRSSGSFRHLSYYLPDFRVLAVGRDRHGQFGHLYTAFAGKDDYQIADAFDARPQLDLAATVEWILIPDHQIARHAGAGVDLVPIQLPNGECAWLVHRGADSVFVFGEDADGSPSIRALPRGLLEGWLSLGGWPGSPAQVPAPSGGAPPLQPVPTASSSGGSFTPLSTSTTSAASPIS